MRGSTPQKRPKHLKIGEKQQKNTKKYLYIYLYFYGFALASSRRDLDASKRARRKARRPKNTHARTGAKSILLLDSASPENALAGLRRRHQKICMYIWSVREKRQIKNNITFLCDIKRDERANKKKDRKSVSEEADQKTMKSHERVTHQEESPRVCV